VSTTWLATEAMGEYEWAEGEGLRSRASGVHNLC